MPCNDLSFFVLGAQPLWSSCWAWWAKVWSWDWPPAGSIFFFPPSPALKPILTPLPNTKSSIKRCLADLPVPADHYSIRKMQQNAKAAVEKKQNSRCINLFRSSFVAAVLRLLPFRNSFMRHEWSRRKITSDITGSDRILLELRLGHFSILLSIKRWNDWIFLEGGKKPAVYKAHFIHGLNVEFCILYSYLRVMIFITDMNWKKKKTAFASSQKRRWLRSQPAVLLIWNCDTNQWLLAICLFPSSVCSVLLLCETLLRACSYFLVMDYNAKTHT